MALINCKECGKEISDSATSCPNCGCPVTKEVIRTETLIVKEKGKWATGKLVIGIISIISFLLIMLQSCAAGVSNAISGNGEISGSLGVLVAIFIMVAGIVGIVTRNASNKSGTIIICILYLLAYFCSKVDAGVFSDLKVWGGLALLFGCIHLFSILKKKTDYILVIIPIIIIIIINIIDTSMASQYEANSEEVITEKVQNEVNSKNEESNIEISDTSASEEALETIEEQVLLEQDGVKITAQELVNDTFWGKGIKLLIENNSDKNLGVGCKALIVNNYMITDLFSSSIAAGKKSNEIVYISSSELEASGISNIGQIDLYFNIYNSDSYETIFDSECITIKTSEFDKMDSVALDEGTELFNQDGIRIIGKYVDDKSFWGSAVLLYLENKSDKNIGISCDNMSVNGFMVTPLFSSTVYSNRMAIDDITIMSNELEENGIESIDEIEMNFRIYSEDTFSTIAETGPITFSAK